MSGQEKKMIEKEISQIDAHMSLLQERRFVLKKKLEEGVSTPSNARKGALSATERQSLVSGIRKKAYQL